MTKDEKALFKRVDDLMQQLVGNENKKQTSETIRLLFNLHNTIYPNKMELSTGCGGCRERVMRVVKNWWINNGGVKK